MRVLIADPNKGFRDSLRRLLEAYGSEVVAEAGSGREMEEQIARYRPDAVLMTLAMPEMLKTLEVERIGELLRRIAGNEPGLSLEQASGPARPLNGNGHPHDREALTRREQQVLDLMARGITSNRHLARRLRVSENTVKFHVRNILDKLRLHDRTQAVGYALRQEAPHDAR